MNRIITILVTGQYKLIRESWAAVLGEDSNSRVIIASPAEALECAGELQPNLILAEINRDPAHAFEFIKKLLERSSVSNIIGIGQQVNMAVAKKIIQQGARGYLTMDTSVEELRKAIAQVQTGNYYICKDLTDALAEQKLGGKASPFGIERLSQRERQVITLVRAGYTSRDMATELEITVKTVEAHRNNINKKLGTRNVAELLKVVNDSTWLISPK